MAKRSATVRMSSVPRCLRSVYGTANHLKDAGHIAAFLSLACGAILENGCSLSVDSDSETMGLSLAFDLLRDKIDIAAGELAFPDCGMPGDEDLPPLWKEEEEGGENG